MDLKQLIELADKATPGEWIVTHPRCPEDPILIEDKLQTVQIAELCDGDYDESLDDAQFISAARTHWPRHMKALEWVLDYCDELQLTEDKSLGYFIEDKIKSFLKGDSE
jgi:hypothetical protein